MKKLLGFITTLFISTAAFAATADQPADQKACFGVEGMTCAACPLTVKAAVNKLDGIKSVEVSVKDKNAVVTFDPTTGTTASIIEEKISSTGFKAEKVACKAKG